MIVIYAALQRSTFIDISSDVFVIFLCCFAAFPVYHYIPMIISNRFCLYQSALSYSIYYLHPVASFPNGAHYHTPGWYFPGAAMCD